MILFFCLAGYEYTNNTADDAMRMNRLCIGLCLWLPGLALAQTCRYDSIPASTPNSDFERYTDGTALHKTTGLTWKRCLEGQSWNNNTATCTGEPQIYTWQSALQTAEAGSFAGQSDWRLPNIKELQTLVEEACYDPAINLQVFPYMPAYAVWSGSPDAGYLYFAWFVYFYYGNGGNYDKYGSYHVRLVRGGSEGNASNILDLAFPLPESNPYASDISSVLDHSGPFYKKDGVILAYTKEQGKRENGVCRYKGSSAILGYKKADGSQVSIPGQGACIWYDGHSGYDYPAVINTPILAAQDGTLCISTSAASKNQQTPWRNTQHCPYGNDPINGLNKQATSWDGWHAFYIVHGVENYTTWYLHSSQLEPAVMDAIMANGYVDVSKGQTIAYVGHWGLTGGDHLHFEARKGSKEVVDPYGWENQPRLWEKQN